LKKRRSIYYESELSITMIPLLRKKEIWVLQAMVNWQNIFIRKFQSFRLCFSTFRAPEGTNYTYQEDSGGELAAKLRMDLLRSLDALDDFYDEVIRYYRRHLHMREDWNYSTEG